MLGKAKEARPSLFQGEKKKKKTNDLSLSYVLTMELSIGESGD